MGGIVGLCGLCVKMFLCNFLRSKVSYSKRRSREFRCQRMGVVERRATSFCHAFLHFLLRQGFFSCFVGVLGSHACFKLGLFFSCRMTCFIRWDCRRDPRSTEHGVWR